jgi:hypothetical protein
VHKSLEELIAPYMEILKDLRGEPNDKITFFLLSLNLKHLFHLLEISTHESLDQFIGV